MPPVYSCGKSEKKGGDRHEASVRQGVAEEQVLYRHVCLAESLGALDGGQGRWLRYWPVMAEEPEKQEAPKTRRFLLPQETSVHKAPRACGRGSIK